MKIHSKRQRWAFLPDGLGGEPTMPDGSTPAPDCCDVTTIPPDRASGDEGGRAMQPGEGLGTLEDLNLAHGTVTSATSGLGAGGSPVDPTNSNDGNIATFSYVDPFVSPGTGSSSWHWKSDLGDDYLVSELTATDYNSGTANQAWYADVEITIQGSADGSSWSSDLPYTGSTSAVGGATKHHYLLDTPATYRHWRMTATRALTTFAFISGVRLTTWEINGQEIITDDVWIPAPEVIDGDDATCITIDGPKVIQLDLGAAYRISSTRLRGSFPVGAKTYTILGGNLGDLSDAVTVATLTFTGTGSAQDIEASWYTEDSYRFFELDGDDEVRDICTWELREPTLATNHQHDASAIAYDNSASGLTADTVQEAIDELAANPLDPDDVRDAGRWELAVITGSPPDPLYADGDFLYIWVT